MTSRMMVGLDFEPKNNSNSDTHHQIVGRSERRSMPSAQSTDGLCEPASSCKRLRTEEEEDNTTTAQQQHPVVDSYSSSSSVLSATSIIRTTSDDGDVAENPPAALLAAVVSASAQLRTTTDQGDNEEDIAVQDGEDTTTVTHQRTCSSCSAVNAVERNSNLASNDEAEPRPLTNSDEIVSDAPIQNADDEKFEVKLESPLAESYVRTRHNNLRCFPRCSPFHMEQRFCGRSLDVSVWGGSCKDVPRMLVFAEFRSLRGPCLFQIGDLCTKQHLKALGERILIAEYVRELAGALRYVIHPPRKWHYPGKLRTIDCHAIQLYLAVDGCVKATFTSSLFQVKPVWKGDEGKEDVDTTKPEVTSSNGVTKERSSSIAISSRRESASSGSTNQMSRESSFSVSRASSSASFATADTTDNDVMQMEASNVSSPLGRNPSYQLDMTAINGQVMKSPRMVDLANREVASSLRLNHASLNRTQPLTNCISFRQASVMNAGPALHMGSVFHQQQQQQLLVNNHAPSMHLQSPSLHQMNMTSYTPFSSASSNDPRSMLVALHPNKQRALHMMQAPPASLSSASPLLYQQQMMPAVSSTTHGVYNGFGQHPTNDANLSNIALYSSKMPMEVPGLWRYNG